MGRTRDHREFTLTGVLESNEADLIGNVAYQLKSDRNPHESAGQRRTRKPVREHWFRFVTESLILAQDKRWRGA